MQLRNHFEYSSGNAGLSTTGLNSRVADVLCPVLTVRQQTPLGLAQLSPDQVQSKVCLLSQHGTPGTVCPGGLLLHCILSVNVASSPSAFCLTAHLCVSPTLAQLVSVLSAVHLLG